MKAWSETGRDDSSRAGPERSFLRSSELVGRDRETASLLHLLDLVSRGHGALVLISGEAGIGKTSLIRTVLANQPDHRVISLTGRCFDLQSPSPYGPWLEIFERYSREPGLPELPEVLKRRTGVDNLTNQVALFEVIRQFLQSVTTVTPLVLVLEDLHWADHASLELLRYLGRYVKADSSLLIATYRDDELRRDHPLYAMLPLLTRESDACRLSLQSLTQAALLELLEQRYALGESDRERLAKSLRERAGGNPLFTVELLRTLELDEVIRCTPEGWILDDPDTVAVPTLIQQIVEARLSALPAAAQDALREAAIVGQAVPLNQWEMLTDPDLILTAIEAAISAHLLIHDTERDEIAFRHALVHEAVYRSIPLSRRRELHGRLAGGLVERRHPDPDDIAHHMQRAADPRAADWLILAGRRAELSYAWRTAEDRYATAISLMRPEQRHERGWLSCHLGVLMRHSDLQLGISNLKVARRIADETGDDLLAATAHLYLGLVLAYSGEMHHGIIEMAAGQGKIDALPDEFIKPPYSWVLGVQQERLESSEEWRQAFSGWGMLALWLGVIGKYQESVDAANTVLANGNSGLASSTQADLFGALGDSLVPLGNLNEGERWIEKALASHRANGDVIQVAVSSMYWVMRVGIPFRTHDKAALRERLAEIEWCIERTQEALKVRVSPRIARLPELFLEGQWSELRRCLANGIGDFSSFWMAALEGWLAHFSGDDEHAWRIVDGILPRGPESELGNQEFQSAADAHRLAATLALHKPDLDLARVWLERYDHWLTWSGSMLGRAEGLLLWAQFHALKGDLDLASQFGRQALEVASSPRQPLVLISAHRILGNVAIEQGDLDSAETHLTESLGLAESCAIPFERARTMLELGRLYLDRSDTHAATRHLSSARTIFQLLDARPFLERIAVLESQIRLEARSAPHRLTAREVEVLCLMVRGHTDREIAEQLFISRHTAMRHVSHILAKLDVESRTAAAAKSVREGIC